jgi:hypothetical protein
MLLSLLLLLLLASCAVQRLSLESAALLERAGIDAATYEDMPAAEQQQQRQLLLEAASASASAAQVTDVEVLSSSERPLTDAVGTSGGGRATAADEADEEAEEDEEAEDEQMTPELWETMSMLSGVATHRLREEAFAHLFASQGVSAGLMVCLAVIRFCYTCSSRIWGPASAPDDAHDWDQTLCTVA